MSLFVCNVPVVATALFNLRERTPEAIRGINTKASTHIFFNRKTERTFDSVTGVGVDGTIVTLGTVPAATATYVDTSTIGGDGDQDTMKTKINLKTGVDEQSVAVFPVNNEQNESGKDMYLSKYERHLPDNGV